MMAKEYLLASDFDQTLSFNDSGIILSEIVGIPGFREKVAGLSRTNLVQQGGELAYLLRHDPDYRGVRREHLVEVGKRIRLKQNIQLLVRLLQEGIEGHRFSFYVISAAPEEVIQSALEGVVPPTISSARGSNTTPPPARSARSCGSRPGTARWRSWTSCRRHCRWAPTASFTWGTAAPTST